jgi:hypothetical protein
VIKGASSSCQGTSSKSRRRVCCSKTPTDRAVRGLTAHELAHVYQFVRKSDVFYARYRRKRGSAIVEANADFGILKQWEFDLWILRSGRESKRHGEGKIMKRRVNKRLPTAKSLPWSDSERERRERVERGETVVANVKRDAALIKWAQKQQLYTLIDRRTPWGNPFIVGQHGDRDRVCDMYAAYLEQLPPLQRRLHELKGRVLGCHCFPLRCHGNELIAAIENWPDASAKSPVGGTTRRNENGHPRRR